MKIFKKANETFDRIIREEVDDKRQPRPEPKKPASDGRKSKLQRIGELVGFGGIVAATAVAALVGLVGCKPVDAPRTPAPAAHCEEDQPCWDCARMGNHRCDQKGQDL